MGKRLPRYMAKLMKAVKAQAKAGKVLKPVPADADALTVRYERVKAK